MVTQAAILSSANLLGGRVGESCAVRPRVGGKYMLHNNLRHILPPRLSSKKLQESVSWPWESHAYAVDHEPSVHPKRRKAEDEDENEGCRLVPTTYYLFFMARGQGEIGRVAQEYPSYPCCPGLASPSGLAFTGSWLLATGYRAPETCCRPDDGFWRAKRARKRVF